MASALLDHYSMTKCQPFGRFNYFIPI